MPMANSDKDGTLSLLKKLASKTKGGPLFEGVAFTALNPFFITWWLTVGLKLFRIQFMYLDSKRASLFSIRLTYGWIMHGCHF